MEKEEMVEEGYDRIAGEYYAHHSSFDNKNLIEEFIRLLPKYSKVLEVGCGAGIPVTKLLVEAGFDVTGIDISETMLKLARKNVPKARFIRMNVTKLDFEADSFDGLTAFYSIIHVPRVKHPLLFSSFHRILKPNGILLVSMGSSEWEGTEEYYGAEMFWSHYSPEKSLQIIKEAGFETIFDRYTVDRGEKHYWILARKS